MTEQEQWVRRQLDAGLISERDIVRLTLFLQEQTHELRDGKLGKDSRAALDAALLPRPTSGGTRFGLAMLAVMIEEMQAGAREVRMNNDGPFVAKYHGKEDKPGEDGAWCAAALSWAARSSAERLRVQMPFKGSGSAKVLYRHMAKAGEKSQSPQIGDLVCWERGTKGWQGHVGLVYALRPGVVVTIEANKGDFPAPIATFSYPREEMKRLVGFARIPDDRLIQETS